MQETKDSATVTEQGERLERLIDGVIIRSAVTQTDARGEICEIYSSAWNVIPDAVSYVYTAMVRPNRIKGWVFHKVQSDRLFSMTGFMKVVLYDLREESVSFGVINEIYLSERHRSLLVIPPFVAHAVHNIGIVDAYFINMPTVPYNHANPDKYRVPASDIPYDFDKVSG